MSKAYKVRIDKTSDNIDWEARRYEIVKEILDDELEQEKDKIIESVFKEVQNIINQRIQEKGYNDQTDNLRSPIGYVAIKHDVVFSNGRNFIKLRIVPNLSSKK